MWLTPHPERDSNPADRSQPVTVPIPCVNGLVTLCVDRADSAPGTIDIGPRWEITYTLELDGIIRTETLGYASTYDDAVTAMRSYLTDVQSARSQSDRPDAFDVKSQLDSYTPPHSDVGAPPRPL